MCQRPIQLMYDFHSLLIHIGLLPATPLIQCVKEVLMHAKEPNAWVQGISKRRRTMVARAKGWRE
jgi:hypothetical protein